VDQALDAPQARPLIRHCSERPVTWKPPNGKSARYRRTLVVRKAIYIITTWSRVADNLTRRTTTKYFGVMQLP
jgi:hypothetical protein